MNAVTLPSCDELFVEIIRTSDPSRQDNDYINSCTEFGTVLAMVLQERRPELEWVYVWPPLESALFGPDTGIYIPVFHWAVKKLSEYGVDDGFVAKVDACCQLLQQHSSKT